MVCGKVQRWIDGKVHLDSGSGVCVVACHMKRMQPTNEELLLDWAWHRVTQVWSLSIVLNTAWWNVNSRSPPGLGKDCGEAPSILR